MTHAPTPAMLDQLHSPTHVLGWIVPTFSAPNVRALMTSRQGGSSQAPWDSLNLGLHVGDNPAAVQRNRDQVVQSIGMPVHYVDQNHGTDVLRISSRHPHSRKPADGLWTTDTQVALAIQVADCLPVLFAHTGGRGVAAAHAGWRGLASGVLEATLLALQRDLDCPASAVEAWLGPCIGAGAFQVGPEVRAQFLSVHAEDSQFFRPFTAPGKWLADLRGLARRRLLDLGLQRVTASASCTWTQASEYFSYRRDGLTGRMAAVIGLA